MVSIEALQEQFTRLKGVEEDKDQLIENLIARVKEVESGLSEKGLHLEREQETTKLYQSNVNDAEVKLNRLNENINSNSFVSVLIDGDCMLFVDEFVRSTRQGGVDAACRLRTRVCEYVSKELGLPGHIPIRTRIYANTKGLASIYCYNKILGSGDDFRMFVRGFNMGHPMCDFVDAGDGKECADSKLRAWFEQDIADVKCRAVIFGGSADNGYARLLLPYVGDNVKRSRIILVEGQPFVKELSELKDSFSIARFSDVFSTTKLASRRVSFSTTPPSTPIPNEPTRATTTATFASAAASKTGRTSHSVATVTAGRDTVVLLNSKGQRLDDIIRPIPGLLNVLKSKKHCNLHHILGKCSDSNCSFLHGVRLDRKGIEARRWIARQAPCQLGLQCRNEKCFLGHECPDKSCTMVGKGCRFTKGMHNVDRT